MLIAAYLEKPISYFFPERLNINKESLTKLDEELIFLFHQLPENQQYIALEYVKQQVEVSIKAFQRKLLDDVNHDFQS